ncbi:MAG: RNA 2',3'-cyclic phosphodiesterase [Steroidobacteraceae bacterium]
MRLFFALWPDTDTRARIAATAAALCLDGHAKPVPRENYHLTLAFIGEVAPIEVAVLRQIGAAQRATRCRIRIDACEYWPQSQVLVAAAQAPPLQLSELQERLRDDLALRPTAAAPDRPHPVWRAHVTLARKVAQAPVLQAMSHFYWNAESFSLVRSDSAGAHSIYTVVDTWPLLYGTPNKSKSL